jgi:hypothetical protein
MRRVSGRSTGRPAGRKAAVTDTAGRYFLHIPGPVSLFVGVDTLTDLYGDGITEELTPPASVQIWGWGGATATGASIVVPFGGEIAYCPAASRQSNGFWGCAVTPTVCESREHQLTLTPS